MRKLIFFRFPTDTAATTHFGVIQSSGRAESMRFWTKINFRTRNHVGTGGIIAESLRLSDVAWDVPILGITDKTWYYARLVLN